MTALATNRSSKKDLLDTVRLPLAIGALAFAGARACVDTSIGAVVPGKVSTTLVPIGVFLEKIDNTLGSVTQLANVELDKEVAVRWWNNDGSVTTANLLQDVYIADDQTVTTSALGSKAGRVWAVHPIRGVAVEAPSASSAASSSANPAWATQTDWAVDQLNTSGVASDAGPGTAAAPLATFKEFARRLMAVAVNGRYEIKAKVTLKIVSVNSNIDTDPLPVIPVRKYADNFIGVIGALVPVVGLGGTIPVSGVTPSAAGQQQNFTDASVTWTTHIGTIITDTTNLSRSIVQVSHASGVAETTEPVQGLTTIPANLVTPVPNQAFLQPVVGHNYTVSTAMRFRVQGFDIARGATGATSTNGNSWAWAFLQCQWGANGPNTAAATTEQVTIVGQESFIEPAYDVALFECIVEPPVASVNAWMYFSCTYFFSQTYFNFSNVVLAACGCAKQVNGSGSVVLVDGYTLLSGALQDTGGFQATQFKIAGATGATNLADMCILGIGGSKILFRQTGLYGATQVRGAVTGHYFRLAHGAQAIMAAASGNWANTFVGTVPGTAFEMDAQTSALTVNVNAGTISTPIALTLANFAAAQASAGFGLEGAQAGGFAGNAWMPTGTSIQGTAI